MSESNSTAHAEVDVDVSAQANGHQAEANADVNVSAEASGDTATASVEVDVHVSANSGGAKPPSPSPTKPPSPSPTKPPSPSPTKPPSPSPTEPPKEDTMFPKTILDKIREANHEIQNDASLEGEKTFLEADYPWFVPGAAWRLVWNNQPGPGMDWDQRTLIRYVNDDGSLSETRVVPSPFLGSMIINLDEIKLTLQDAIDQTAMIQPGKPITNVNLRRIVGPNPPKHGQWILAKPPCRIFVDAVTGEQEVCSLGEGCTEALGGGCTEATQSGALPEK